MTRRSAAARDTKKNGLRLLKKQRQAALLSETPRGPPWSVQSGSLRGAAEHAGYRLMPVLKLGECAVALPCWDAEGLYKVLIHEMGSVSQGLSRNVSPCHSSNKRRKR